MQNFLRTKIIATLGPSTSTRKKIRELLCAGAGAFRLNTSHGEPAWHAEKIQDIRAIAAELNLHIPIILDLQGPKIRVGNLLQPINLQEGDKVVLKHAMAQEEPSCIPVDYSGIVNDLKSGNNLLLDDGKIQMRITSVLSDRLEAVVTDGGLLTSRKGVNIPDAKLNIPSLSQKDINYIKFAVENNVDWIALSFVRTKEDLLQAKEYIKQAGGDIPIIAKIEKPIALDNIEEIMDNSEGIMVARGDLGIEISPQRVPVVQKHLIKRANTHKKVVITATQMLESMINEPIPTRAEASDVANAIFDGTDAVMLSGETAAGKFPLDAVKIMRSIAEEVECSEIYKFNVYETEKVANINADSQAITDAAMKISDTLEISAIVAFTRTGFTAELLSKGKPSAPVIAVSNSAEVCRKLGLLWGIEPFFMDFDFGFTEEFLQKMDEFLVKNTSLKNDDKIIITGVMLDPDNGSTNFIRLHDIKQL